MPNLFWNLVAFLVGILIVAATLNSAIQTVVVPRNTNTWLTRLVFATTWALFYPRVRLARSYEGRDRALASFAPIGMLMLPLIWFCLILAGYTSMFWSLGIRPWQEAFFVSSSSLVTLGFAYEKTIPVMVLIFSEATLGLALMALLIAYLPTLYAAFSQREAVVTLLEAYAGAPPSPVELIARVHRLNMFGRLSDQWSAWEMWFAQLEESHSSYAALVFFRSPQPNRSWITTAGVILDAAALSLSCIDAPRDAQAALCLRAGFLALRRIADFFEVPYDPDPRPGDPISISQTEFNLAYDELIANGVPVKSDRQQAWVDYAGWRVNYDTVLVTLAAMTMAPYAQWSSDRSIRSLRPRYLHPGFSWWRKKTT